jgi:succinyl-diaminopimelate desuccinylase
MHDMVTVFSAKDPLFEPPYSTFEPTKKDANVPNINTIPGEDVFYMDCRILPQYPLAAVRKEVEKRVAEIAKKYGVTVDVTDEQAGESPATPSDAPVVKALGAQISRVYGVVPRPIGIGGGTVAAGLRRLGLNAVVWHRDTGSAHSPNEYCLLESLLCDTKVIAGVMAG